MGLGADGHVLAGILDQIVELAIQQGTIGGDGDLERQQLEPPLGNRGISRCGRYEVQATSPSLVSCCRQADTSASGVSLRP